MSTPSVPSLPESTLRVAWFGAGEECALDGDATVLRCAAGEPLDALRELGAACMGGDLLLLERGCVVPPHAIARLVRAAEASGAAIVVPLGNADPALTPLAPGATWPVADLVGLDRACHALAAHRAFRAPGLLRSASLWRRPALAWACASRPGDELPDALAPVACDHVFVGDPRRPLRGRERPLRADEADPPSPLDDLRSRLRAVPESLGWPGADGRPVVLHVLHGWGGGAEGFVRDLARADATRCHLALLARGSTQRARYGEWLELAHAGDAMTTLARWPLDAAIAATSERHDAYRALLDAVVARCGVGTICVSSLIGHSLDALRTGLPTVVVAHDYYPYWPQLHCDFGDAQRRFDRAELERALAVRDATPPFAPQPAARWWALREATVEALVAARARLVAPTAGVVANLLRIEPRLAALDPHAIAHGLRPFADVVRAEPPARTKLRVLVLGRVAGGKGETLLRSLVPRLRDACEFHLLGCGTGGYGFMGIGGATLEFDYERDALPARVAAIAPDLALMPVTVAETWSYTLSELWALGVPPLACAIGSLAERIEDGVTGLLVAPDVDAIERRLRALAADRQPLRALRARLAMGRQRDTAAMAGDYAPLWRAAPTPARALATTGIDTLALAEATVALERARHERDALAATAKAQARELERRAEWGFGLARELDDRTAWAKSLEADLEKTQARMEVAEVELDRVRPFEAELTRVHTSRSWRITQPLRTGTVFARRLRSSLAFRLRRALSLFGRARRSLQMRGIGGTLRRAFLGGMKPPPVLPPDIPATEPFAPFAVPGSDAPRVSIVVPVYNHFAHTLTCLRSLAQHPGAVPFEVIVVDDCSSDETPQRLPEIAGIRALRNAQNLGFIGACNAGAAQARGEYVLFLNNDTAVTPGWLEALVDAFAAEPRAGLVGAKLVYPDGRLQEAGGIVFADASGWNYGRFDDPSLPQYNFLREVDYCSGAAIMLPRALWTRLGGFDVRYAPAYYEDTDLAFRVREAGYKVLYQPASTVVHFEGVTSGTDTASGVKRYQVVNQQKFAERWAKVLPRQPRPGVPIARARAHGTPSRVLIVDACTPMPDQDSGSVRMINLMRVLRGLGWQVTFMVENLAYHGHYTHALQRLGVEAVYHPNVSDIVAWMAGNGATLDAVILSRHYVAAAFLPLVRQYAPHARIVFDTVDLHYLREQRAAELHGGAELARQARATRVQELKIVRAADVTLVVSPVEQGLLRLECPGSRIEILSNVHEVVGSRRPFAERRDIQFTGGFGHPPNVDAVQWFVDEIWPDVARRLPEARFHVIGSRLPEELTRLAGERVVVHGHVESLDEFLDGCRLSVAPLRYGAGVKGKVNMAMAHGQPVIATPIAVEGMHVEPGEDVLVAEDAQAFADAVVAAYQDEALWQKLSTRGVANVARHFSFDAARDAVQAVLPRR